MNQTRELSRPGKRKTQNNLRCIVFSQHSLILNAAGCATATSVGRRWWVYWGESKAKWCHLTMSAELLVGREHSLRDSLYMVVAWCWNLSTATKGKTDMIKIDHVLHETFMKRRMLTFIFRWKVTHFWISCIPSWDAKLGVFFLCQSVDSWTERKRK